MHKWSKLATSGLPFLSLCLSYILVLVQILHAKGGVECVERPSTIKQLQAGTRIYENWVHNFCFAMRNSPRTQGRSTTIPPLGQGCCLVMLPFRIAGSSSRVRSSGAEVFHCGRGRQIALELRNQMLSSCHWSRIRYSLVLACAEHCLASERWDRLRLD